MPCYKPLGAVKTRTGKISFRPLAYGEKLALPCGKCIGCKLEHSRQVALRCTHEAKLHEENTWVTLTYADEHLPYGETLVKDHYQNFIKRLRKRIEPIKIRHYGCGEYGENKGRPHYHICIFGYDFGDKYFWRVADSGEHLYRSDQLESLWTFGNSEIGELTFETAAYTARYCTKKITGEKAFMHYTRILLDGRMIEIEPEFALMSLGKKKHGTRGLGYGHYELYKNEIFPSDECIVRGNISKPPRYYFKLLEEQDPKLYEQVKKSRHDFIQSHKEEQTLSRRTQREKVKLAQMKQLQRPLEETQ